MNSKGFIKEYLSRGLISRQEAGYENILGYLRKPMNNLKAAKSNIDVDVEVTFTFAYLGCYAQEGR